MVHRDIESLSQAAQPVFREFLNKLDEAGIKYAVIETFRDADVQAAYYAQGRRTLPVVNSLRSFAGLYMIRSEDNTKTVTNCDGAKIKSKHQYGKAVDIAPLDAAGKINWNATKAEWEAIGLIGEALGLTWGGRFGQKDASKLGWDCPHFEANV